jgi:STE24 endopeptidase
MANFDPAAATAAYLSTVPASVHARATAYTQGGHWFLLGGTVVTILAAFIILKSGVLQGIARRVQGHRTRPFLTAFACVAAYVAIDWVIELPWNWFADWRRNTFYGMTHQPVVQWLVENLIGAALSAVFMGLFLAVVYLIIRRAPRYWWLFGGAVAALFVVIGMLVAPIVIEPIFNTYKPAPPGAVRDAVVALAKETGTPSDKIYIYNGSRQSDRYTANVAGLFGSARVALSDTMFRNGADLAEVRAVVGHEMGHYAHLHALVGAGVFSLLAMVFFFLTAKLFEPAARLMGSSAQIYDPVGLPVLMAVIAVLGLLATPIQTSLTRITEADADSFSFEHAKEPDGFARAMMKTIGYRAATPSGLEEVLFYDHPSIQHRIRAAMDWKAAHQPSAAK